MFSTGMILCLMFGCLGFFLSFFLLRIVNIALLSLMAWVSFKVVENCGLKPEWQLLDTLKQIMFSFMETFIEILSSMLNLTSTTGMVSFLVGAITGMILNMKRKHQRVRG